VTRSREQPLTRLDHAPASIAAVSFPVLLTLSRS
jgi:hypothetical protein